MASTSAVTLDDLISSPSPNSSAPATRDEHLFYPTMDVDEPAAEGGSASAEPPRQLLKDRLYIGNLHPSVDEYTLLQVFSKFGRVTKLDYLFHKTGLLKGKPRGYAFIEYGDTDAHRDGMMDALKALTMAHEKPLRGRKLVVTFAQQAPLDQYGGVGLSSSLKNRKTMMDVGRPTTLSMLKTGVTGKGHGGHERKTQDKIAMMEAKLRQMESTNPRPKPPPTDVDVARPASLPPNPLASASSPSLPYHPSLPMKPPPMIPGMPPPLDVRRPPQSHPSQHQLPLKPKPPYPGQTIGASSLSKSLSQSKTLTPPNLKSLTEAATTGAGTHQRSAKAAKLVGVKIKPKEKSEPLKS